MYIVQNCLNFALGFGFENSLVRFVTDMQIAQARRATQPCWVPTEAQAVRLRGGWYRLGGTNGVTNGGTAGSAGPVEGALARALSRRSWL